MKQSNKVAPAEGLRVSSAEAILRFTAARDEFLRMGEFENAASCLRQIIVRKFRRGDHADALDLAERLTNEAADPEDHILLGLLRERAGDAESAREAYELALDESHTAAARALAKLCLDLRVPRVINDAADAEAQAALGNEYFEMGLLLDAAQAWLEGMRKHPRQPRNVELFVEKLIAGDLTH